MIITEAGKDELALALLLWKDFKSDGKFDIEISTQAFQFAKELGIQKQFGDMMTKLPPMKITIRK